MTPEDEMILFTVLQDIADELRRIKRERQEESPEYAAQSTASDLNLAEISHIDQEN